MKKCILRRFFMLEYSNFLVGHLNDKEPKEPKEIEEFSLTIGSFPFFAFVSLHNFSELRSSSREIKIHGIYYFMLSDWKTTSYFSWKITGHLFLVNCFVWFNCTDSLPAVTENPFRSLGNCLWKRIFCIQNATTVFLKLFFDSSAA